MKRVAKLALAGLGLAAAAAALTSGCSPGPGADDETETGGDEGVWLDLADGCDVEGWASIEGREITVLAGGQGLLMFALPLRVGGVEIDTSITEWADPNIPQLNFSMFVEGHDYRADGSMIYFANYPLRFSEIDDETYEWVFLPVFVPDEVAPAQVIDGESATIEMSLSIPGRGIGSGDPIERTMQTTIRVNDPIDPDDQCGS